MTRKPTSDEQFGVYEEGDSPPSDQIADELGTTGYLIKDFPDEMSVVEDDDA